MAEAISCQYLKDNCPNDYYCIQQSKDKSVCVKRFEAQQKIVSYPFSKITKSFCDQGSLTTKDDSHSWSNTAFAIDLIGDRAKKKNTIFAGANGKVITSNDCKTQNDQCGLGFGNQVKILTDDNFIVFYAHLKNVFVKTGDFIKQGEPIGEEGDSGWTGENNRHLHLSVHFGWKSLGYDYWKPPGYLPFSVPFKIKDCHGEILSVESISCKRNSNSPKIFCEQQGVK
jgi:hypothetical protein